MGRRGYGGCDLLGKEVFLWWSPLVIPWCSHLHILVLFSYDWELRSVFWCSRLHKAGPLLVWYSTLGDLACEWQAYGWVLCSICDLTEPNSCVMRTRFCYFTIILFLYVFMSTGMWFWPWRRWFRVTKNALNRSVLRHDIQGFVVIVYNSHVRILWRQDP